MSNKDTLKTDLSNLFGAMLNASENETKEGELYQKLIENPGLFSKPDNLFFTLLYPQGKAIGAALTQIKALSNEVRYKYVDVFTNYQFYENHIEKLCTHYEGSACCADKSRTIVGRYLNFIRTGDKGNWEVDNDKCYWLPRFGTQDQWYALMDGLYEFCFGKIENFVVAYNNLIVAAHDAAKEQANG